MKSLLTDWRIPSGKATNNMRVNVANCRGIWGAAWCVLAMAATVQAGPVGQSYTVLGINFPNDYPATSVTFDGVQELVGGPAPDGMLVNESETLSPGIPGGIATNLGPILQYEMAGSVLEWQFQTADGGGYNNNASGPVWGFSIADLDFGTPSVTEKAFASYVYFFGPAGPVALSPILLNAFGLQFGAHPTNPAITQVIYLEDDDDNVYPTGIINIEFGDDTGELNSETVSLLAQQALTGIALGGLFIGIPEPSTWVLAGLGLLGLVPVARSRRARR